jgi:DNA-binding NarL/FixJ family response regulator
MSKSKILLADDHLVVAQALSGYLEKSFEVQGIVSDGLQLLEHVRKHKPDLIIADLSMPKMSGIQSLRQLSKEGHHVKMIFLTMHDDPMLAREAIQAGAVGYVLKESACEELIAAVTQALSGNIYISSKIARVVLSSLRSNQASPQESITPRQREVLQLVVKGLSMKEVAAALHLSRRTVETHKYDMMETLGVGTTTGLVEYAFRHNLVENHLTVA